MQDIKSDAKWDFVATKYPHLLSTAVKAGTNILEPVYEPVWLNIGFTVKDNRVSVVCMDLMPYVTLSVEGTSLDDALEELEREFVRAIVELTKDTWPLAPAVFESLRFEYVLQTQLCLLGKSSAAPMLIPFTAFGG